MSERNLSTREIQSALLGIYREIAAICARHGLRVFMVGGTALGAVRHGGFIPWDDDMDLAMPRRDYRRFIRAARRELPAHMRLKWVQRANIHVVEDRRYRITLNGETAKLRKSGEPAFVSADILAWDGVPNGFAGTLHAAYVFFLRACYKMCRPELILNMGKRRDWWEYPAIAAMRLMPPFLRDEAKWQRRFNRAARRYDYDRCGKVALFSGVLKFRNIFPRKWIEPGIVVPFEDTQGRIPSEYDAYLRQNYGDYMTIPKEADRESHTS